MADTNWDYIAGFIDGECRDEIMSLNQEREVCHGRYRI